MDQVAVLVKSGNVNLAARIVHRTCRKNIVGMLIKKFGFSEELATSIFHMAIIKGFAKIISSDLQDVSCAYFRAYSENLANNERRTQTRKRDKSEGLSSAIESKSDSGFDKVLRRFDENPLEGRKEELWKAFQKLDDKCKKLLTLHKLDRIPHSEIPKYMSNISNARSSKTLLSRCWRKLKESLKY